MGVIPERPLTGPTPARLSLAGVWGVGGGRQRWGAVGADVRLRPPAEWGRGTAVSVSSPPLTHRLG